MDDYFKKVDFANTERFIRDNHYTRLSTDEIIESARHSANQKILTDSLRLNSYGAQNEWVTEESTHRDNRIRSDAVCGMLIGIKPIQKDTAESILNDLVKWAEYNGCIIEYKGKRPDLSVFHELIERAKSLKK